MAERDTKVVYKSRIHPAYDDYPEDYYQSDRRSQRYYEDDYRRTDDYRGGGYYYDDRRPAPREIIVDRRRDDYEAGGYVDRDCRDRGRGDELAVVTRPRQSTRTEYDFLSDIHTRSSGSGNVIVLDSRDRGEGGSLTEWEIIRPERNEDGVLVIDAGDIRGDRRGQGGGRYEIVDRDAGRRGVRELEVITGGSQVRAKSVGRRSLVDAMQEVRVTEDEDRRSVYSRGGDRHSRAMEIVPAEAPMAPHRMASALRHDHSPSSDTRRRSRSIGFHKSQIRHHDVTECKHERPGAEAAIAGRYLIDHRGERIEDDDLEIIKRRRRHRHTDDGGSEDYEYERREKKDRYYEQDVNERFEERSRPYSPQRGPSPEEEKKPRRRRRHRHRREEKEAEDSQEEDDRRSYYSERYTKTKKVYD